MSGVPRGRGGRYGANRTGTGDANLTKDHSAWGLMRPSWGSRHAAPVSWLIVLLLLAMPVLFAGCMADTVPSRSQPSLIEAHESAKVQIAEMERSAQLVGFVAKNGLDSVPAPEWFSEHAGTVPDGGSGLDEGRASAWVLLYATMDGRLIRAVVQEGRDVEAQWVVFDSDSIAQALWGMNLGGRLLADSTDALSAARAHDPDFAAHLQEHPDEGVAIVSAISEVSGGQSDLVYAIYWGPPSDGEAFSRFVYVHHYTGEVVKGGEASSYRDEKRIVLVDETFTLGPIPMQASHEEHLPVRVEDVVFSLTTSGVGEYTVRLLHENQTEAVRAEGFALVQEETFTETLEALAPGNWVLQVEVTGQVTFALRIEGAVPVQPWQAD